MKKLLKANEKKDVREVTQENKNVANKSSGQDKNYIQRLVTSKKRLGKVKSTSLADSNICLTTPEESKGKVRIIRKRAQSNRGASGGILIDRISRPISSKNKRAYKKVSFDDIKNLYGSTPENTSSESNETLPYNKYYQHVHQAQDIDSSDKAFRKQDKICFVNRSNNNGSSAPPMIMDNADTPETTEYDVNDQQAIKDTTTTSRNSNKNNMRLANSVSRNSSLNTNKSIEILKSAQTHTSIKSKSPPLVSSIPKPSAYINRSPVTLSNKYTGASTSGVKFSSPVTLSTKGTGASTSGVKSSSPVTLSTKDKDASTSGAKSSSPVTLSTKDKGASTRDAKSSSPVTISTKDVSTSGAKPSSPAMDILQGASISKDFSNLKDAKNRNNNRFLSKEPLDKDIPNMNIYSDKTDYSAKPSLPLEQHLNKVTEVQIQPGEIYNNHVSNEPGENKTPVEISNLFYSQRKEGESDEHVQSRNPTNTAEDSLKSGTIENVSTKSTSFKYPTEKMIKNFSDDIVPSENAYKNHTKVLAFPGHVGFKTPFQNGHNTKNAFDEDFEFVKENGSKQEDTNISRKLIEPSTINSDHDKETLVNAKTIISDLSSPEFKLEGNTQNTSFNVFYASGRKTGNETNTLNLSKYEGQDSKKIDKFLNKDNISLGNGPKGLLIFVNKKTIDSFDEFDDASLLTREDFPVHGSYRQKSSKYDDRKVKRLPTESSGDSKRNPYISSEWDSGKQSPKPKDTEKSSRPKSDSEGRLGKSRLFSRFFDKIRQTFGEPVDQYKESNTSDETFEGHISPSLSKKSDRKSTKISLPARSKTEGSRKSSPISTGHGYPKGSSDMVVSSQDKPLIVERSRSGSKITQKYPCGCLRIIIIDQDNELETEEFISAFCRAGSLCEIQHPELQKNKRIIELPKSPKSSPFDEAISVPLSRCWFPNIEIVADGIISKNKIPERPPAPTMKGAKLAGSINIKTDKLNGVCNLYFDPRLLRYLIANIDEVKAVAEEFREH